MKVGMRMRMGMSENVKMTAQVSVGVERTSSSRLR
jgi:hypothetical protein